MSAILCHSLDVYEVEINFRSPANVILRMILRKLSQHQRLATGISETNEGLQNVITSFPGDEGMFASKHEIRCYKIAFSALCLPACRGEFRPESSATEPPRRRDRR